MKRHLNFFLATAIVGFAITACEDVPEPYTIPGSGSDTTVVKNDSIYLQESFATGFGAFTVKTEYGTPWAVDYSTAKATGYDSSTKTTTASKSWIVSTPIDLTKSNGAYLQFSYILRYVSSATTNKVLISTDYVGDVSTATWTDITGTLIQGADWNTFSTYSANLPSAFIGKSNVVIALNYSCTTSSSTWEVKNLLVKEGQVKTETPTTTDYLNETFASSFGAFTVSNEYGTPWTIDYSTAKASGYDSSSKSTTASKSWLISKSVDLSKSSGAYLEFSYILRYASSGSNKVLVSTDYAGDPTKATWTDITGTLTEGTDWSTFATYKTDLPASVIGKSNVVVALCYTCTTSSATWEVKNLALKEGTSGNTGGGGNTTSDYVSETFATSFGSFTVKNITGTAWINDYSTAKASGYDNSSKSTTASESYLVSKAFDLSKSTGAYLQFSYILRYVSENASNKVLVTDAYTGDPTTTKWTDITGTLTEGTDWSTFASYSNNLPSSVIGKSSVVVALYYKCNSTNSSTWEVKNLTVKEGSASGGNGGTGGGTGGEVSGNSITLTMSSLGLANAADLTTTTLSDGTVLTFATGDGSNGPKYYTSGTAARLYAKNTLTITSNSKKIVGVAITCASPYNGTNYNGNDALYGLADTKNVTPTKTDTSVTFSSLSCNTLKIVNENSSSTGGVQLRIVSLVITYAQ
jgi:hypothetical protein